MNCLMTAWNKHQAELHGWLLKQSNNPQQAEDLLQDVFIKALNNKQRFCTLDDARSWLFTIAKNTLIDASRKQSPQLLAEIWPEMLTTEAPGDPLVLDQLLELQACMRRVLAELDDDDREVIEQCDIHHLSQQAFADQQGLTLVAVKSRIQRARRKLRANMVSACQIKFDGDKVCCFTSRK